MTPSDLSGNTEERQPSGEIKENGHVFANDGDCGLVSKWTGDTWRQIGQSAICGSGTVGKVITFASPEDKERGMLRTSLVKGVTYDGDGFVIRTVSGSRYKFVPEKKFNDASKPSRTDSVLEALRKKFQSLFLRGDS